MVPVGALVSWGVVVAAWAGRRMLSTCFSFPSMLPCTRSPAALCGQKRHSLNMNALLTIVLGSTLYDYIREVCIGFLRCVSSTRREWSHSAVLSRFAEIRLLLMA